MRTRYLMMTALVAAAMCSCAKDSDQTDAEASQVELTFRASFGTATRTVVQENGTSVWWSPGDKIQVFYGSLTSGRFTSTNPEAVAITQFTGSLPISSATLENGLIGASFWGVYPYNVEDTCDGESLTLAISAEQTGAPGTFAEGQFPAVAKSNGMDLAFYNVCGGIVFTVVSEGIRSVTLTSNNGEALAGKATVSFNDDDYPEVQSVASGVSSVTLTAPFKGTFTPGVRYFITLLPGTLSGGYSMTFKKDSKKGVLNRSGSVTINRSRFRVVSDADASITFTDIVPDPKNIVFADELIKEKLVATFDTDDDGELSYAEAAAVKVDSWEEESKFVMALSEATLAKTFDEFQYFTGIKEIPVTCFSGFELLTSIVLPKQLTQIGHRAFEGCLSLSDIAIPSSVETIGEWAFRSCSSLTSIDIPDSVTEMGRQAFEGCHALSSARLSDNLQVIPRLAFYNCDHLSELHLPTLLTTICDSAFGNCRSLVSVEIPRGVHTIEGGAFGTCTHLQEITLPEGLAEVGSYAFSGCERLRSLVIPSTLERIEPMTFSGCKRLESIELKVGLKTIGYRAFEYCSSLMSLDIPQGVLLIEFLAFQDCSDMRTVTIPLTVQEIDDGAFMGCSSLQSVAIPDGMLSIANGIFQRCVSLRTVSLPDSVREIGSNAFSSCSSLRSLTLPQELVQIGASAFLGCASLTGIAIPEGVTTIYENAFAECTSLSSVSIPETVSILGEGVFRSTALQSIAIPADIHMVPNSLCSDCKQLDQVYLPDSITRIGSSAFWGCSSLKSISLPEGLLEIHDSAFLSSGLVSITIPHKMESIGADAFNDCAALKEVILQPATPFSVSNGQYDYHPAFGYVNDPYPIYVPHGSVEQYRSAEGWSLYGERIVCIHERN